MKKKEIQVNRNYKDTLFRMLFQDKKALLSLYNAVNDSNYSDPEELEIVTLENAIYMNMKNDLAFILDCSLNLYEHQSTYSANMPLRNLLYITREIERFVNRKTLYSSKLVKLPTPRFLVFYNGPETEWERKLLKLSDAYERKMELPELELLVTMININRGKNSELKEKCRTLFEYMEYVEKVRRYSIEMDINQAVEKAVRESIHEGILKDFLIRNRAEAIQVSIFEYDEERELKLIRADEREIGREIGREEGLKTGLERGIEKGIQLFILDNLEEGILESRIIEKLMRRFELEETKATEWVIKLRDMV